MTDSPSCPAPNLSSTPVSSKVDTKLQGACDETWLPADEPTDAQTTKPMSELTKREESWKGIAIRQLRFELDRMARDTKMIESQNVAKHLAPFPYKSKH